ncbi:phosphatidylinositol 3-kinase catalytic subunit type 3 [Agrilus planipennis]|uniref:Phosphatidylinositol 3-kinase catalytic subunit type 3 n=1 Tax=Agrilus planipennis TaxID=224129 RepID=A0A7F5RCA7_AGRPL|nr:phosphatidylinositol 3-kinase catalytic subunit type 3 [Agrilus planipennis]
MEELVDRFHYVLSSSLTEKLVIKIGTLEGTTQKPEYDKLLTDPLLKYSGLNQEGCADLMVMAVVYDKKEPLALPVSTSYKTFTSRWNWNEWITLPVQFSDLPRNSQLALTIYDCVGPNKLSPVGGTTVSLFSKYGLFRQGMLDLRVWPNKEADGNFPSSTPGKVKGDGHDQMQRLAKLAKKHRNGHITKVDWLDRLTFRELEMINEKEKRCSNYLYLMIEFPTIIIDSIPHQVVYFDQDVEEVYQFRTQADVVTVPDHEILKENLVESKHHKLARSLRSGLSDKDAKPNATVRDMLNSIVSYPATKLLTNEEQDNVWKFRFYLSNQKKALTKFLKCVNWTQNNEVRQALSMLELWAPMDVEDALELLSPNVIFRKMYLTVMKTFCLTLSKGGADYQKTKDYLASQQKFINSLVMLVKTVISEGGNRAKKMSKLQQLLADPNAFKFNFANFEPFPFPLDPEVYIKGILSEKASLFNSALMPSKLHFVTTNNAEYVAIFKHGDDLRQDQLILQMITLMDKLLRKENLDLKLTPYRVLATSAKHGFLQYIDSVTVAEALAKEGSIHNFFRKYHPQENGPYGIAPEIMDTYVRSCAGYCVITYLLGVGDRHLDNLLLTESGKLFHIDFGYILGRDPKPLPPPMKLSKEMVEGMGGISSEHYQEFRKQCYTAFLHLRRHANLMLNLFSLMVDASVPDIALEPDKAVRKVQDKLRLDLSDEEAVHYMQNLIDLSVTAVMAALVEQLHKFAQYWRK